MTTLTIERTAHNGLITIKDDNNYNKTKYQGYTLRQAISKYRHEHGLLNKKINIVKL